MKKKIYEDDDYIIYEEVHFNAEICMLLAILICVAEFLLIGLLCGR